MRLGSVLVATAAMWLVARAFFDEAGFPPNTIWAKPALQHSGTLPLG